MRYIPALKVVLALMSSQTIVVYPSSVRKLLAEPKSAVSVTGSLSRSMNPGSLRVQDVGSLVF